MPEISESEAVDKITRHLIECIVIWNTSAPDAHKAQFEITAPNGIKTLIDFLKVTEKN